MMNQGSRLKAMLVIAALVAVSGIGLVALGSNTSTDSQVPAVGSPPETIDGSTSSQPPGISEDLDPIAQSDPDEVYDPVEAGEDLPPGYRPTLPRDAIRPIYEPVFVDGSNIDWSPDTLVIGVSGVEEAKAYPVTHLNSREIVNDTLEGDPILVTW
jgi:hypothetical protein